MTTKTTPKDFFMHLAAAIILYVSAGALINLAFAIINYAFPDPLAYYFSSGSIAWPISLLVILVPVLYLLEWLLARDISRTPDKKDLWIRRWRIYLTVFLGAALIIGDLIALLNTFLTGEITIRFIFKMLVILLVGGTVSKYYYFSLHENYKWSKMIVRFNTWFGIVLVLASIVSGFIIVGSPAKQRAMRFDSQRVNDLMTIQWQVVNQWQQKGALPADLSALTDSISGFKAPMDPATGAPYEYSVNGPTSFDICATFALESEDTKGRGAYGYGGGYAMDMAYPSSIGIEGESWAHEAGRDCFTRTIDPSRYPVNEKSEAQRLEAQKLDASVR